MQRVGEITEKDKLHSEFTTNFRKALGADGFKLVDFTLGLSIELAKKEDIEVDAERTAANIACAVWNKFLRRKLLECVENETVNFSFFPKYHQMRSENPP